MPIYAIVNGATSDQLDVNQYKSWWVDGSLTSQPANMIYSGASAAVSITQNGSGNILSLNGTISASVDMSTSGVIQSTPAITATGTVVSIKHIYLKPTMTLANNANAIVRVMTIRGILTLNGTGSPLGAFLDIGNPADSSVILSANAEFDTVQLDYPTVTLNGHVLNANSATLLIASAPSGGFSVRDTSAGKWLTGSGGVTVPGGGMSITGNSTLSSGYLYIANGNLILGSMTTGFVTDANNMTLVAPIVSFSISNHANTVNNFQMLDNGNATFLGVVTISPPGSAGLNVTGDCTFASSANNFQCYHTAHLRFAAFMGEGYGGNYIRAYGNINGSGRVDLSSAGTDTNIDFHIVSLGTGNVVIGNNGLRFDVSNARIIAGNGSLVFRNFANTADTLAIMDNAIINIGIGQVSGLTITPGAGANVVLSGAGTGTDISMVFSPKGAGSSTFNGKFITTGGTLIGGSVTPSLGGYVGLARVMAVANGAVGNLTAPVKGTGQGPIALGINTWWEITIDSSKFYIPIFQ